MYKNIISSLSKTKKRKLLVLISAPFLITILYSTYRENKVHEIKAVDHLLVEYESGGPTFPIFTEKDFKPGDCATEKVTIHHLQEEEVDVMIKSSHILDSHIMAKVLSIIIKEDADDIYGGTSSTGEKTLQEFFNESRLFGRYLSTFTGVSTKLYEIIVCFDVDAGNKYQEVYLKFDLSFFEKQTSHETPCECSNFFLNFFKWLSWKPDSYICDC